MAVQDSRGGSLVQNSAAGALTDLGRHCPLVVHVEVDLVHVDVETSRDCRQRHPDSAAGGHTKLEFLCLPVWSQPEVPVWKGDVTACTCVYVDTSFCSVIELRGGVVTLASIRGQVYLY